MRVNLAAKLLGVRLPEYSHRTLMRWWDHGLAATEDGVTVLVGASYEQAVLGAESHHTVVVVRVRLGVS